MTRAFLGLGSNVGDRARFLREAVATLGSSVRAVSDVYETEPVGGPSQGPYLNVVVELDTDWAPASCSACATGSRARPNRVRTVRWGPRTLDVDVLWIDGVELTGPDLVIPHPRMWRRRFVLAPLAELAPDLVDADALEHAEGQVHHLGPLI